MASRSGRQYTVRGVSEHLDRALRERSRREGSSLNDVVLEALEQYVGVPEEPRERRDLDDLVGTWVEDTELDEALEAQRRIDEDLWR
jgi:hypothetical protein